MGMNDCDMASGACIVQRPSKLDYIYMLHAFIAVLNSVRSNPMHYRVLQFNDYDLTIHRVFNRVIS